MNSLLDLAKRGYTVIVPADGAVTGSWVGVKAADGAGAELKVTNAYGDSENDASSDSMTLLAGEIELVTATTIQVVSGKVRAYINSNPPV